MAKFYREYFGKGSGVLAFERPIANLTCTEVKRRVDGIEESRLADTTMAAEEGDLARNKILYLLYASALDGGNLIYGITNRFVDGPDFAVDVPELGSAVIGAVEVALVEYDDRRDMVGLSCNKEPVDEASRGARKAESGDNAELVDVGSDNVGLFGELGSAADDAVAAVGDVGNHAGTVVEKLEGDAVANGDGICLFAATKTEIATQTTVV